MSFLLSMMKMLPDAAAQGLIWGILAIGVFITYKLLDFSDLTVDGSICTGGAVAALLIINGVPIALVGHFDPACTVLHQSSHYGQVYAGGQC